MKNPKRPVKMPYAAKARTYQHIVRDPRPHEKMEAACPVCGGEMAVAEVYDFIGLAEPSYALECESCGNSIICDLDEPLPEPAAQSLT